MENKKKCYTASLDLMKYPGAVFGKINGKDYVCIPTDNPTVVVGQKGIYLNLFIAELAQMNEYGGTHIICPSLTTKEEREAMSEADRKLYCPIVGNLKLTGSQGGGMQAQAVTLDASGSASAQIFPSKGGDDLPAGPNTQSPADKLPWE